jgi:hypothetical protein
LGVEDDINVAVWLCLRWVHLTEDFAIAMSMFKHFCCIPLPHKSRDSSSTPDQLSITSSSIKGEKSNMSLAGKVIIVTGGSKGIGRAISHRLAQDGASVVVNFSRDASAADEVVKAIGSDKALAVQADVGSVAGVEKLVAATVERFGRVDVVIPNAGIMPMRTTGNTTEEDFDRAFALNVKGPYFLAQVRLPLYTYLCLKMVPNF